MNLPDPEEDFATRRAALAAEIARQRIELTQAYAALARPIHYAEVGMRGVGFLRANPWIFAAAPAALSIASTLWNFTRKKPAPAPVPVKGGPTQQQMLKQPAGLPKVLLAYAEQGLRLYQLYRRVRAYLP